MNALAPQIPNDAPFTAVQKAWLDGFLAGLAASETVQFAAPKIEAALKTAPKKEGFSKDNPFSAPLLVNRILNHPGSGKDTRHYEISLAGSGLKYEVGDALGVCPTNCPEYVDDLIKLGGFKPDEPAPVPSGGTVPLREAFLVHYDITKPPRALLEAFSNRGNFPNLERLLSAEFANDLANYLWGRETIDLFKEYPHVKFAATELVGFLKKLAPRLYSIASSLKAHPEQAHLTVASVRYESHGRKRKGVCSTFLADRAPLHKTLPVFVHQNNNFRLPADASKGVIMIGPGTGIAPFRAYLEERKAMGAKGKHWLFFGDRNRACDFLYEEEFEAMLKEGALTRLDLAFSRDQDYKIYVQNRIMEHGKEFYKWIQEGAHIYVCGDASRMARDVNDAILKVLEKEGGMSPEDATAFVQKLRSDKRYQRDVY